MTAPMTRQRAKALKREILVLVTALRLPGTLRTGDDVERLCALALEATGCIDLVVNAPLRTGGPE
jgi:hypothetical protein